ncbi:hypothetical protein BFP72_03990 [Reichenbachiella sp. 5M10]|uniref:TolC family protein n=1 Tax=Reichenbachiella sp. 5M10 TaxID=1889772 RepID=UPI000C5308E4|nr:TolC family protein [Reichenbachiella sp. 5M10]PIB34628.1 hypothetical protein BFP72_03990 [Reichenbachiella sp. 5M10]
MKRILTLILLLGTCLPLLAQSDDNLLIIQEDLDRLILSAIENSTKLDVHQLSLESAAYQKKMINNEHLSIISLSGNLNEYSIRELSGDQTVSSFYPRYNVGLSFRLNHFSEIKNRKKLLEKDQQVILKQAEILERDLIEEVKKKYIEYLKTKQVLNIRKRLEQFSVADFNAVEQKFSEGSIDLPEYSAARRDYYSTKMQVLEAESRYQQAKTELETVVNNSLESMGIE